MSNIAIISTDTTSDSSNVNRPVTSKPRGICAYYKTDRGCYQGDKYSTLQDSVDVATSAGSSTSIQPRLVRLAANRPQIRTKRSICVPSVTTSLPPMDCLVSILTSTCMMKGSLLCGDRKSCVSPCQWRLGRCLHART
ncbi:hypothetical protein BD309DRAFT_187942 [Dichomitus squalens]|nr:hypothetical protein BD309DRAFT_187942 [Dichomitus squalens]